MCLIETQSKTTLECHTAAREAKGSPPAHAATAIHTVPHSPKLAIYVVLAVTYDKQSIDNNLDTLLLAIALKNEMNSAKINWNC